MIGSIRVQTNNDLGLHVATQETPKNDPFFCFLYKNNVWIDVASLLGLRGTVNPADKSVV